MSFTAASLGVTAVLSPTTDITWEGWLYHWTGAFVSMGSTIASGNGTSAQRIDIDNKAMRKIGEDESLICIMQTNEEVGTSVLNATLATRCLQKLA